MGTLFYGERTDIAFDDRTLFHLQLVIGAKLRRGEAFFFSWKEDVTTGSGRGSIWIQRSIPLSFKMHTSRNFPVNRRWLEQLTLSANSAQGLFLTEEPLDDAESGPEPTGATSTTARNPRAATGASNANHSTHNQPVSSGAR
ncbi:MAG: ATP-dependent DNA ligase [Glaciihabitans sp.]